MILKNSQELRLDILMFEDLIKFCTKKMYHEVEWVKKCSEVVPAAETIMPPVNGRLEFTKVWLEKGELLNKLLLCYEKKRNQNKENIQPTSNL
jgi:hypothetical protein